jgi:hypothetical protein
VTRAWLVVACLLLWGAPALAQPAPTGPIPVDKILDEATRLYAEDADYAAARKKFQDAYNIRPSWKALNGIALCHAALGNHVAAYHTYQRLLREFGARLDAERVANAKKRMAEVRGKIGELVVEAKQPGARVSVDGADVGKAPLTHSVLVEPGRHVVDAKLDGHVPFIARVQVAANGRVKVKVSLRQERERLVVKLTERPMKRRMKRWIPWATIGGGVALLGAGGLVMLSARGDLRDFDDQVAAMAGTYPVSVEVGRDELDSGRSKRTIAGALYAAGGLAAVTGVVLVFLNQPRPVGGRAGVAVRPDGAALWVRF